MKLIIVALLMSCLCISCVAKNELIDMESGILRATNIEREKLGFESLLPEAGLSELARYHSNSMAEHNFFAHEDHLGMDVGKRTATYYSELMVKAVGENLYSISNVTADTDIVQKAIEGWMNSPGHRANILNGTFTHLGVGIIKKDGKYLITQVFATPIVKLKTRIPATIDQNQEILLHFDYMRPESGEFYEAYLKYPDPNKRFFINERTYVMGFEPIKLNWKGKNSFSVKLSFAAGAGDYMLSFGEKGTYLSSGYTIKVN